jgi:hypothetical protein
MLMNRRIEACGNPFQLEQVPVPSVPINYNKLILKGMFPSAAGVC